MWGAVERFPDQSLQPIPRDRWEWLQALAVRTECWREWRARELERAGDRVVCVAPETDESLAEWISIGPGLWHRRRAKAHRERFQRLAECGGLQRRKSCDCGRCAGCVRLWCDDWRLCLGCKGRRARFYRERLEAGRRECLRDHAREIARRDQYRWSERMMTATVPHSGNVARDIESLASAWRGFRGSLARYMWRLGLGWRDVPFWRSLEVTESEGGHAHYHVWMLSPYLPRELLRHWWGRALPEEYRARLPRVSLVDALEGSDPRNHAEIRRAALMDPFWADGVRRAQKAARQARNRYGRESSRARDAALKARDLRDQSAWLYAPVMDVRKVSDAEDLSQYMTKGIVMYLVKDTDGSGSPMPVEAYAPIYAALEGARVVAASRHWAVLVDDRSEDEKRFCDECGAEYVVVVEDAECATGPPFRAEKPFVHTSGTTARHASQLEPVGGV